MRKKCINCKHHKLSISQCQCGNCDSEYFEHMVKDSFCCGLWNSDSIENAEQASEDGNNAEEYDYVDHPSHYGGADNPYECIKVIEAWGLDKNFDLGTAVRYINRVGKKPDNSVVQDLEKAVWYLNREIGKLKNESI